MITHISFNVYVCTCEHMYVVMILPKVYLFFFLLTLHIHSTKELVSKKRRIVPEIQITKVGRFTCWTVEKFLYFNISIVNCVYMRWYIAKIIFITTSSYLLRKNIMFHLLPLLLYTHIFLPVFIQMCISKPIIVCS